MVENARKIRNHEMLDCEEILVGKRAYRILKRAQDIFLSALALVVSSPLMLLIALLIFIDDPKGSPIFVQERCGRNGKVFRVFKLRSMVVSAESQLDSLMMHNEKDGPVFKIRNDPRITRIGAFIRRTSIDELPQLVNVLLGEMSLVGPRPCLPREAAQYNDYQRQRLYVQPGLTCYWQIQRRRDEISFDDWVDLDIQYIRERSFLVDWKIIFQTIPAILRMDGE